MTEIISVRFKEGGKSYYFNPNGMEVAVGEKVIIETSRGVEFGECVESNRMIDEMELVSPLRPVLRLATQEDLAALEQNRVKEQKAFGICQQKIQEHGLDMKLVEVEYSFDGSKILFFFTSEGRVDFRALVRDLAGIFHTRIELRQIGVRDEAKLLGGLGICGRPFCCSSFLDDFHPVSIKMAKTQNLSLNPTKISGVCGRLMCCLKYEQEAYEDVLKRTPKVDSLVETPDGVGTIISVQLLREKVKVKLDLDPENPRIYDTSQITVVRNGKGKRPEGYELPEPEEHPVRLRNTAPAAELKPAAASRPVREQKPVVPAVSAGDVENPEADEEEAKAKSGQSQNKRRHRSRSKSGGAKQEGSAAPNPEKQPQQQKKVRAPKSQPQSNAAAEGGQPKEAQGGANAAASGNANANANKRRRRTRKRPSTGENAAPKKEE